MSNGTAVITREQGLLVWAGNRFDDRGFIYKKFPMNAVLTDDVKPSLAELDRFETASLTGGGLGIGLGGTAETVANLSKNLPKKIDGTSGAQNFIPGDCVEVVEGDLKHLTGIVKTVENDKIVILPKHKDINEPLEFVASELRKFFKAGDHVKVTTGTYEGDTGLIVRVEDDQCVLFSDISMHELKVRPKDLQLCREVAPGVDSTGQFRIFDFVEIDPQTVGVVVRIERDQLQVLNMHGKLVLVKPQALRSRNCPKSIVTYDGKGQSVSIGDTCRILDGPYKGQSGTVKYMFRGFVFLQSKLHLENGGAFTCRAKQLELVGTPRAAQLAENTQSFGQFSSLRSPSLQSPKPDHFGSSHQQNKPLPPGKSPAASVYGQQRGQRTDRRVIGQTVRITQGPYKNLVGIVKDATDTLARVELHAYPKVINVDRSRLEVNDAVQRGPGSTGYGMINTPAYGSQTPAYGMDGGKTPMYGAGDGGITPMYGLGGRTPMYGDAGGRTPMHDMGGGRTPAGAGGSSVWDPKHGNTPAQSVYSYTVLQCFVNVYFFIVSMTTTIILTMMITLAHLLHQTGQQVVYILVDILALQLRAYSALHHLLICLTLLAQLFHHRQLISPLIARLLQLHRHILAFLHQL